MDGIERDDDSNKVDSGGSYSIEEEEEEEGKRKPAATYSRQITCYTSDYITQHTQHSPSIPRL